MRILVTGSTGFLGRHLEPALIARGHSVIGVARGIDRVSGVLSSVDCVVHLAAQTEVGRAVQHPAETFDANVRGTWNVLEACRLAKIRRVITASTDKAYGRSVAPYDESTPLTPDRPYETSKACADMIARTYASTYGMGVAVTRCVNLYGPGHLNFSTLIPGTIKRILHGEAPMIRNHGTMKRDFLFVRDAVEGYMRLVESDYVGPVCFGTNTAHSVKDVVDCIRDLMDCTKTPKNEGDAVGEIDAQWSTYERAKAVLGWKPTHSLRDGLKETIAWYEKFFKGKA
jgi:CDP-glucose 4,6-dehydratase